MKDERTQGIKKDLQKTIKAIRDGGVQLYKEFPKAMMTSAQMEKGTGTVNCGVYWCRVNTEPSLKLAEQVMADERFAAFLQKHEVMAEIELAKDGGYQIRLHY